MQPVDAGIHLRVRDLADLFHEESRIEVPCGQVSKRDLGSRGLFKACRGMYKAFMRGLECLRFRVEG